MRLEVEELQSEIKSLQEQVRYLIYYNIISWLFFDIIATIG